MIQSPYDTLNITIKNGSKSVILKGSCQFNDQAYHRCLLVCLMEFICTFNQKKINDL